ncbi:MAG: hypothetical protein J5802_10480 [Butyrivibrio sp.]|nr:hypothetical protein [Butyrivibrio sp.]
MKNSGKRGINIGTASILLVFSVLCLISFATLTLINSKADYTLSKNLSDRQLQYYSACHKGNAFVSAVNSGYSNGISNDIMKESISINDIQTLDIAIFVNKTKKIYNSDNTCSIIQWQVVNHDDTEYDYTLPVMK